jgi:CheY-like chemotaxis protein
MPGLAGPEVVSRIRGRKAPTPTYVILLTSRDSSADIVAGLKGGADDYVTKPADQDELIARVNVGARVVQLQSALAERVRSLEEALANVKALQTLLPMCAYCKSIRNDQNYWEKVETYFTQHSNVSFTHSYCPNCYERFVRPELEALEGARAAQEKQRRG